ncbi:hypothetical protein QJS10_CPB14g00657 [Acorus calamus]|uniref:Cyclin C-terminal domain-containing protein n=1 Tax=Acorus calamus TaxID=4465 RepID=A0AAV9DFV5_ACOCL|nr:hypothetical protein QJS10_CPB14g00657 [Acorus calamus]
MAVLEALDWRLSPVTAHSYVELLTWHLVSLNYAITARLTELLLASLSDPRFLEFRPSIVAVSALRCTLEELTSSKCNDYATRLTNFNSQEYKRY